MNSTIKLNKSWQTQIGKEFDKPYMQELNNFLLREIDRGKVILPPASQWFNAFNSMSFDDLKVVIVGQDPYPTVGHAHGLCFSVLPHVKPLPKSLLNINKELLDDLGIDNSHTGYLQPWANQGVLLLNTVLTVEQGKANSHRVKNYITLKQAELKAGEAISHPIEFNKGWEAFTDTTIEVINNNKKHIVFILWGANAHKKIPMIDSSKHLIIRSVHPSPLSAYRGFFGSKPFSQTNQYLMRKGKTPINWRLRKTGINDPFINIE